jgi:flagellar biosynthesis/type III secretory pathway M-ring protein FliF/YscJ
MNSIKTVRETEDVGIEIMSELERNREKIQSSRTKVHDFVGMTDTARRMIAGMENRDTQQKMVLGFIAVFLIIAIALVIYFSTNTSSSSSG